MRALEGLAHTQGIARGDAPVLPALVNPDRGQAFAEIERRAGDETRAQCAERQTIPAVYEEAELLVLPTVGLPGASPSMIPAPFAASRKEGRTRAGCALPEARSLL